jgi:hypothetical protein
MSPYFNHNFWVKYQIAVKSVVLERHYKRKQILLK